MSSFGHSVSGQHSSDHVQIHEFKEPVVSEKVVQEEADEQMAQHSPDGRPADGPARHRGRVALWLLLLIGLPAVLAFVILVGGFAALGMGIVYVLTLALVSFPVWYAGIKRSEEEVDAKTIVRHTIAEDRAVGHST